MTAMAKKPLVYNPPPNWPKPPAGWRPEPGWTPDVAWGPMPAGWQLWVKPRGSRAGRAMIGVGVVALVVAGIAIAGSGGSKPTAAPAASTTSPPPTADISSPAPVVEPSPDGEHTDSCDYLLGLSGNNTNYSFVGQSELHNTGNIGLKIKVVGVWKQVGAKNVTATKTVLVAAGRSKTVNFSLHASPSQIDRIQAYAGDTDCVISVAIESTYGSAS